MSIIAWIGALNTEGVCTDVEWCRKMYVLCQRWNSITINWFPMYMNFQQQFSPAYPPWRRLLLWSFWQTRAQLFLNNQTWAFPSYQTNNRTVATRRMHDGWSLSFHWNQLDQPWRQKSHDMFARSDSKVRLQQWHSFFVFPKSRSVFLFFYLKYRQKAVVRYIEVIG